MLPTPASTPCTPTSTFAYLLLPTNHVPMPPCPASTPCDLCLHATSIYAMHPTPSIYAMHSMHPCPASTPCTLCPHAPMQPGRQPVGQQLQEASTPCNLIEHLRHAPSPSIYAMHPKAHHEEDDQPGQVSLVRIESTHTHQHSRKYRYLSPHTHSAYHIHTHIHYASTLARAEITCRIQPEPIPTSTQLHTYPRETTHAHGRHVARTSNLRIRKPGRSKWPL
ncbi:hypothetical protein CF327_g7825 [Tilletia walkeri]|nr:hypothetical protein CF327_g7825 [Tilletia walkeri]